MNRCALRPNALYLAHACHVPCQARFPESCRKLRLCWLRKPRSSRSDRIQLTCLVPSLREHEYRGIARYFTVVPIVPCLPGACLARASTCQSTIPLILPLQETVPPSHRYPHPHTSPPSHHLLHVSASASAERRVVCHARAMRPLRACDIRCFMRV